MATNNNIFQPANEAIIDDIKKELRLQGHYLTGTLEASFKAKLVSESLGITLTAEALGYLESLENFTPPNQIDISFDEYRKLKQWVLLRGLATEDVGAGKVAQQIITKWKKVGRPGPGSGEYSATGTKTDAVKEALDKNADRHTDLIDRAAIGNLDNSFTSIKSGTI